MTASKQFTPAASLMEQGWNSFRLSGLEPAILRYRAEPRQTRLGCALERLKVNSDKAESGFVASPLVVIQEVPVEVSDQRRATIHHPAQVAQCFRGVLDSAEIISSCKTILGDEDGDLYTLPVALSLASVDSMGPQYGVMMAGAVLIVAPIPVIFMFLQDYFIQGLATAGLKG